jgi:hypothetical protein
MKNNTVKARLKSTGELIEVYKLKRGGWCNFKDCTTTYKDEELEFQ